MTPKPSYQDLEKRIHELERTQQILRKAEKHLHEKITDGTPITETSGVPVFDAAGKISGYRGVDRKITQPPSDIELYWLATTKLPR